MSDHLGQSETSRKRIDVALGFTIMVDDRDDSRSTDDLGRDLADHLVYVGNPRLAPIAVVFLRATEVPDD